MIALLSLCNNPVFYLFHFNSVAKDLYKYLRYFYLKTFPYLFSFICFFLLSSLNFFLGPLTLDFIRKNIRRLPLAHQITLKYLLQHLYRVASKSDKNKMNPFNLSSVFAPSVLCPTLISLNTLKIGTNILETMIREYPQIF